ncbi:hypothetical protein AVEN_248285-1 [Araneus ventricosus]|uniref:Uncharacterized protein n=1 Tax=Araneus ventricosus TaxID=182803 RepID=A0A4Y2MPF1_ARAVE|nr:hypothetical protein AVEN_248285-1 [Araneus ventricosus]
MKVFSFHEGQIYIPSNHPIGSFTSLPHRTALMWRQDSLPMRKDKNRLFHGRSQGMTNRDPPMISKREKYYPVSSPEFAFGK